MNGRQFTSKSLNLNDEFWGETSGTPGACLLLEPREPLFKKALPPLADNLPPRVEAVGNLVVGETLGGNRLQGRRRKRDSNPRDSFPPNGFQDRRLKPLGHSSAGEDNRTIGASESSTRRARRGGVLR